MLDGLRQASLVLVVGLARSARRRPLCGSITRTNSRLWPHNGLKVDGPVSSKLLPKRGCIKTVSGAR
jgi:hypothetical protein